MGINSLQEKNKDGKALLKLKVYKSEISSDISVIGSTVEDVLCYIYTTHSTVSEDTLFELKVVLNELILNAIKHGNLEDYTKSVKIVAVIKNSYVAIVIEDEGRGYDYKHVLEDNKFTLNATELCSMRENGRGILIVSTLCERVKFNDKGNKIIIYKKL